MKKLCRILKCIICAILTILLVIILSEVVKRFVGISYPISSYQLVIGEEYMDKESYPELVCQIPAISGFSNANVIKDMVIHNDKVYFAIGDGNVNSASNTDGYTKVYTYHTLQKELAVEVIVPEEEIGRFVTINDSLAFPGADSVESWKYGNWYELDNVNDCWLQHILPGAIHCFDIQEYHGKFFAGIGGKDALCESVLMSMDGGVTFESLPLKRKEGRNWPRCVELAVLNDTLYAFGTDSTLLVGFYEYLEETNEFVERKEYEKYFWPNRVISTVFNAVVIFREKLITTDGRSICIFDGDAVSSINTKANASIFDIVVKDDIMYVLAGTPSCDGWNMKVYQTCNLKEWFHILSFEVPTYSQSFAIQDNTMFFGLGSSRDAEENISAHNGEIYVFQMNDFFNFSIEVMKALRPVFYKEIGLFSDFCMFRTCKEESVCMQKLLFYKK